MAARKYDKRIQYRLTDVSYDGETLLITHAGNMGHSLELVNANLDEMDLSPVEYYKENYDYEESGSPDYYYKLEVKVKNLEPREHENI